MLGFSSRVGSLLALGQSERECGFTDTQLLPGPASPEKKKRGSGGRRSEAAVKEEKSHGTLLLTQEEFPHHRGPGGPDSQELTQEERKASRVYGPATHL